MTKQNSVIAEISDYIILEKYTRIPRTDTERQSEQELEKELIADLIGQGYEYLKINKPEELLANARTQLQKLNNIELSDQEWQRFVDDFLLPSNDDKLKATEKVHNNYFYDFKRDDGTVKNIYLFCKEHITRNQVQVIQQFAQSGNRYDVTILVNGLPMLQIELKRRGVAIREAFNQVHRYNNESYNQENSLYKYLQIFVISNGTHTRYFANTIKPEKSSFNFTITWADYSNELIEDLKDFTATFLQKNTLLRVLLIYSVFDTQNNLLIMRPYQIAATERLIRKIESSYNSNKTSTVDGGGYIWHATGSGKTLTSFKAAQLATKLNFIDKVLFVVDRKDLDYQTMKEYQRFSPDSVYGSNNTAKLKENLERVDGKKIIVTTIQKLNNLTKNESNLRAYQQQVVFIFDECHRSQFGEAQKNITKKFKKYYQFGFTGTPIFPKIAKQGTKNTAQIFGTQLHHYIITDAIRDEKVLKFKVDYHSVYPKLKEMEKAQDEEDEAIIEMQEHELLELGRIQKISKYILDNFDKKTHRNQANKGFNAMFAVGSVKAAKEYYKELQRQQEDREKKLKIATIFSFVPNSDDYGVSGEIKEEKMQLDEMNVSDKQFLSQVIADYNKMFHTSFDIAKMDDFENYYRDLAKKMKSREVDLTIVVGMFLTGFDAPTMNTLFVDKKLRYHGLIQAFSRTNRIYNETKQCGNIVAFRDLEQATEDAVKLFGKSNTKSQIIIRGFQEYLNSFTDDTTGKFNKGYIEIVRELRNNFSLSSSDRFANFAKEIDKKNFVELFGSYLNMNNILSNFSEYSQLKDLQKIDKKDAQAIEKFKEDNFLTDEDFAKLAELDKSLDLLSERDFQDYCSIYNDIREEKSGGWGKQAQSVEKENIWNDVVWEIELLKSLEIDLDYILKLIGDLLGKEKNEIIEEVTRMIRASNEKAKEGLIVDFIKAIDLGSLRNNTDDIIDKFYEYARGKRREEAQQLIEDEKLNKEATKLFLIKSLKQGRVNDEGTELKDAILPKMSPLDPQFLDTKNRVVKKLREFVGKFKGIGGEL